MDDTNRTLQTNDSVLRSTDRKRQRVPNAGRSSRYRFNNRTSFILTATTLALLGVLSIFYGSTNLESSVSSSSLRFLEDANDDGNNKIDDYSNYSCRYINDNVSDAEDLCNYATTCNNGQGVWAPWVFCSSTFGVYSSFAILSPVVILWMVTLFRLLGSTAEDFFSCSLEMFSLKLGLPPRFAGVTLLALGNGAADVSATISAIVSDEENGYKLSLGALTGAAMLVGGVISGIVVLIADGVKCRGALIRDVLALCVTVIIVWVYLSGGVVTHATTTSLFGIYGSFVCIVLAADIYHRVVVLPRMRAVEDALAEVEQREAMSADDLENNPDLLAASGVRPPNSFMQMVTSFSNYDNASPPQEPVLQQPNADEIQTSPETDTGVQTAQAIPAPVIGEGAADEGPFVLRGQNGILNDNNHTRSPPTTLEMDTSDVGGHYTLVEDQFDRVCVGEGSLGLPSYNLTGAFHDGKQEILEDVTEMWNEIFSSEGELKVYERFLLLCEFPFTLLRKVR